MLNGFDWFWKQQSFDNEYSNETVQTVGTKIEITNNRNLCYEPDCC